jgi:type VI secretion system secreted protein VgrG
VPRRLRGRAAGVRVGTARSPERAAMAFTQESSSLGAETPLGGSSLILWSLAGQEAISRLFSFQLGFLSETRNVSPAALVGKPIAVRVGSGGTARWFHGYVRRFAAGGMQTREFRGYQAEIVPWFWFLTRRTGCRIFQNKSTDQIVKAIFAELGFSDFDFRVRRSLKPRDYCVQYRESDYDFVSRLLEEEGVYYYFAHEKSRHVMVIADDVSAYRGCGTASYLEGTSLEGSLNRWSHGLEFRSGKAAHTDFDFTKPSTSLRANTSTVIPLPGAAKYELYDQPGRYTDPGDGGALVKIRMEEEEAGYDVVSGGSSCPAFFAGGKFTVGAHAADLSECGKSYAFVSVEHRASDESYMTEGAKGTYQNSFRAIPDSVVYRPPRVTPRPVVRGCQTAIVVGPKGEEIYTDKYGRVKVQFHWDREGKSDENSSCWVRVAQNWAGKGFGVHFHPRIGQEVLVDFLEGDPDRPIITGRVYNAEQMPPYSLPANQTQGGVKSRSSKGGTDENFNEIRFEDKKGSEEIYVHAEKNYTRVVENDDVLKVGLEKKDKGNQTIEVHNDRTETVHEGNETVTIKKGNRTVTVEKGNDTHEVKAGTRTVKVEKDDSLTVANGARKVQVKNDVSLEVEQGNRTVTVSMGDDTHKIKMGNRSVVIEMGNDTLEIKMGNRTTKLSLGKETVEAMQGIELKVGQNSVKIDQMGITLKGMMITIDGQVQTEVKGLMLQLSGSAMAKLGGGITMIG